jgi:solute carrier family 35 (UDP-sugar transporter), member A1/2/3
MKIVTTALFSVWMLHRLLSRKKWIAITLLTIGIALVQLPSSSSADESKGKSVTDQIVGLVAVTVACILSGLAGVWFEKVLKGTNASIWVRNIQLSFFSLVPGFFVGGI